MQRRTGGGGLGAVLFTDIVGSTLVAAEMGNARWIELVARHHRTVRRLLSAHGGREVDTAGDGFFAVFERPADAIRCAVEAAGEVRELGIEIRAGVSFGELETAGVKPGGLVVNTAARLMSVAGPGEVLVPASVSELVPGSGIAFVDHGVHQLKGFEGEFRLLKVVAVDGREVAPPPPAAEAAERRREIFPTGGARRSPLVVGVAAGAVVVAAVIAFLILRGDDAPPGDGRAAGPLRFAVAQVDPVTGEVGTAIHIGKARANYLEMLPFIDHPIAAGEGGVWALQQPHLLHIDPVNAEVRTADIQVGFGWGTVETGFDSVWLQNGVELYRIHPATDELEVFVKLQTSTGLINYYFDVGTDALWVGTGDGTLVRIDPATRERREVRLGGFDGMAVTSDRVWLADILEGEFVGVDADTMEPSGDRIRVGGTVDQVVADGDILWAIDKTLGVVTRIDVTVGEATGTARVGDNSMDLVVGLGAVWVGDRDGTLTRIDTATLQVRSFTLPAEILGVAVDERTEALWVYLGESTDV
ncbi:MAG TPA: adenylate/guanylate cyclase domain-containing protein [Actinomycetota bacterium]